MADQPQDSLSKWMAYLQIGDCPCRFEWKSLGRLYKVNMGKGWIRMNTNPDCPHHGRTAK